MIGSISEVTRRQVAYLQKKRQMKLCTVKIRELLDHSEGEKNRDSAGSGSAAGIFLSDHGACAFEAELPGSGGSGQTPRRDRSCGAGTEADRDPLRVSVGRRLAKYFLELLEPEALDLIDEVAPLAVYGKAVGGMWDGLQILTKGGMIGEEDTLDRMLRYAEQKRSEGIIKGRIP